MSTLRCIALTAAALSLAACASMDQGAYRPPETRLVTDEAYVSYVEYQAKKRQMDVVWVNLPQKRVKTTDQGD